MSSVPLPRRRADERSAAIVSSLRSHKLESEGYLGLIRTAAAPRPLFGPQILACRFTNGQKPPFC